MEVIEYPKQIDSCVHIESLGFSRDGQCRQKVLDIPVEHVINVFANNKHVMVLTCTPHHIVELLVGRLYTEGFIERINDIECIEISEGAEQAFITLRNKDVDFRIMRSDVIATCTTHREVTALPVQNKRPLEPMQERSIDAKQIVTMADVFAKDTPLHSCTSAVHSCSLFDACALLCTFEDLGRHNALDKAIGFALCSDMDMRVLAAYTSGRVPVDMVTKAIRARIPLLVTKAVPTTSSVTIAQRYGLGLVGKARPDSFCVFSGTCA